MDASRLKREINPMSQDVLEKLQQLKLEVAFRLRPPYQQNDYLGWISRAKTPPTREKRVEQMLSELEGGEKYMGMKYNAKK